MRVLVVEDSAKLQRTIALALRNSGYAVDVTGKGDEGLWMASEALLEDVHKTYGMGHRKVCALAGVSATFRRGEFWAIAATGRDCPRARE